MLHVAPPPSTVSMPGTEPPNPFDPIAYLGHCRSHGMQVRGGLRNGVRWLSHDLGDVLVPRRHSNPKLDIDADPDNQHLVWEALRAEAYLDACRECGLVLSPFADGYVLVTGEDEESADRDYGAGTYRMREHRDGDAKRDCRRGIVFRVLCARFGLAPDDPCLVEKVNARMLQAAAERVAS